MSPSGIRGQSPGRESGDEVPGKLKQFANIVCLHIKIWKFHTIYLPILDKYVSRWRLSNPLGAKAP